MTREPPPATPPGAWTVTHSSHRLRDRWISVRADHCVTPEGHAIAPFYVLEYPDWVQVVAIDGAGQLILVEQYRHGLATMSLELPTGGVEPEDADPLAAAVRELAEETGYGGGQWRSVATLAPNPANQSNRCHVVLAQGVSLCRTPRDDPAERMTVLRRPIADVVALARGGAILQAMHVAALALALGSIGRW